MKRKSGFNFKRKKCLPESVKTFTRMAQYFFKAAKIIGIPEDILPVSGKSYLRVIHNLQQFVLFRGKKN